MSPRFIAAFPFVLIVFVLTSGVAAGEPEPGYDGPGDWTEVNSGAAWDPRAGLQVLTKREDFYLMGGRTPRPPSVPPIPGESDIWGDVWKSEDRGWTWYRILETDDQDHWPARAYFEAVKRGPFMYVLGGQNFRVIENPDCPPFPSECPPFVSVSDFFNDVWRSRDGVDWKRMTGEAGWEPRAGLSAVVFKGEIYVLGGSVNDDESIVGGPPARIYYNDVWKSRNGRRWVRLVEEAPWAPRAGAAVVAKDDYIYLLGGEFGFVCEPLPFCDPPYFNDVWRTPDGIHWELVTPSAGWSPRPGHRCAVVDDDIFCFGGFGLLENPMDVWASPDGATWTQVSDAPWNAVSPDDIKYDFDVLTAPGADGTVIYTFGGDRETFDFTDPTNYLRVDNDVWHFDPPDRLDGDDRGDDESSDDD
jgi:hypothetical protein